MLLLRQIYESCGLVHSVLLVLSLVATLFLQAVLLWHARSRSTLGFVLLVGLAPFLVGLFGTLEDILTSLLVMGRTSTTPTPADFERGAEVVMVSSYVGGVLTTVCLTLGAMGCHWQKGRRRRESTS